jgi:hypothetical protein
VNNNVYIVSEFCTESLREYLTKTRRQEEIKKTQDIYSGKDMAQKLEQ